MELKQEIPDFVQKLVNSRGKLLAANIGNTSFSCLAKHERISKDFEYCKALYKTNEAWAKFMGRHEKDIREVLIANRSLSAMENRLMLIVIKINSL